MSMPSTGIMQVATVKCLTLRWCNVDAHLTAIIAISFQAFLLWKTADSSIMGLCGHTVFGLSMILGQKSLTLHWCSFLWLGTNHVSNLFGYNANQSISFWSIWQCSSLITKSVRIKIVDASLTVTWNSSKHSLYSQWLYAMNRIVIIDNQYSASMYYHLHPDGFWTLNVWSTTIHSIWVMDDVVLSHSHASSQ